MLRVRFRWLIHWLMWIKLMLWLLLLRFRGEICVVQLVALWVHCTYGHSHGVSATSKFAQSSNKYVGYGGDSSNISVGVRFPQQQTNYGYKPRQSNSDKAHLFCDFCKFNGHTKDTCYKLHGYSADFKFKKREGSSQTCTNNVVNSGCFPIDEQVISSQSSSYSDTDVSTLQGPVNFFTQEQQIMYMLKG